MRDSKNSRLCGVSTTQSVSESSKCANSATEMITKSLYSLRSIITILSEVPATTTFGPVSGGADGVSVKSRNENSDCMLCSWLNWQIRLMLPWVWFSLRSRKVPTVQHITTLGIYFPSLTLCALALKLSTSKLGFSVLNIVLNILFHHDFSPSLLQGKHTNILTFCI